MPQLAELVYDRNKERNRYPHINLKGFIVRKPHSCLECLTYKDRHTHTHMHLFMHIIIFLCMHIFKLDTNSLFKIFFEKGLLKIL